MENNKIVPPIQLEKRIGGITYLVAVNFKTSGETAKEKILRLIKREVNNIA
ncbi:MAG: transposon-encoded TnpW family protein [Oscillospiraceae bacterium]|nr:transposon-encoded TnpW family protein [Oscillospiraceae bacterium]